MIEEVIDSLSELLDDDLHYSHTKGGVDSKAQFLSSVESKRTDYLAAKRRDVEVRLFGNRAVVTGLSAMKLIWGGKQYEFTIRFLEVSRKVDANWQRGSPFGSMPTDRFRCKQSLAYRQVTPAGNPSAEGFFTNAEVMLNPSSTESAGEKPHSGTATPSGRLKHQRSW